MRVRNHRLVDQAHNIDFIASPNIGGMIEPRYLVIHYSAGINAAGCIDWFRNPSSKMSAHLVIARDGAITQMVPFNRLARRADKSPFDKYDALNRHSIGIELDNAEQLVLSGGQWVSPVSRHSYTAEEVALALHRSDLPGCPTGGARAYTEAQLAVTLEVCLTLVHHYGLVDILGHDDIAPMPKRDPDPDLPGTATGAREQGGDDEATNNRTTAERADQRCAHTLVAHPAGSQLAAGRRAEGWVRKDLRWQVGVAKTAHALINRADWCPGRFLAATGG